MENQNPFILELDSCSDDEIFEIIASPSETDNPEKYTAALTIALKRELISEYQAENLLDGNTTVLDYNPNNINLDVEDFKQEKEIYRKESSKKLSNIQYGLMLIACGVLLLLFAYFGDLWFPTKTKIVGFLSVTVGLLLVTIGFLEKRKQQNTTFPL